ncbi:MAG: hypothetical protein H6858_04730 [Rhodospirillales bacterium]|nr:hypothetical protein [Alphaproteobacteria bacterium]MCB9976890.1 hypothetical protein [Rhodospirillales bacterium]
MKEIEIEIVTSAEEDYEEIYSLVTYISMKLGVEFLESATIFFKMCDRLRKKIPLEMFYADKLYGEMKLMQWHELSLDEIVNGAGEISGPPYYYVSINTSQNFGYYINLVKTSEIN